MSTNLYWRHVQTDSKDLPDDLKRCLRKQNDGFVHKQVVDISNYDFIKGLAIAGIDGAQELLDLVSEFGEVEIFEN